MKPTRFIAAIGYILVCGQALAQIKNIDEGLSSLTTNLVSQIKDHAKKKVAVIDFTDLEGESSEFGKFIAEEMTINFVSAKPDFSILDRANLKSILAEHQLTAKGLVDPENAKRLGQFAGVDTIILGNVVQLGQSVELTAKAITTDTAEIVGAARVRFQADETVQQLMGRAVAAGSTSETSTGGSGPGREFSAPTTLQKFRNFTVELLSFRILPNNTAFAALQIVNNTTQKTIAVAANSVHLDDDVFPWWKVTASIVDNKGNLIRCTKADGLCVFNGPEGYRWSGFAQLQRLAHSDPPNFKWVDLMTELKPGEATRLTLEFGPSPGLSQQQHPPKLGRVFKLQSELIAIEKKDDDETVNPQLQNIYFDNIMTADSPNSGQPR